MSGSERDTKATIVDVARRAGVSVSTVSRVLNDRSDVSGATRNRVQLAMSDLAFTPAGRSATPRTNRAITMLLPVSLTDHTGFDLDFVIGAASAASERGYFFNLVTGELPPDRLSRLCRTGQLGAVIVAQVLLDDWRLPLLASNDVPFVTIGRPADTAGLSFVDFDSDGAIVAMFDLLVGLGHRRIAFLGWPLWPIESGFGPATRHHAGFQRALARYDLPEILIRTDIDALAITQAVAQILERQPIPTAIVTTHRIAASAALRSVQERGLFVPRDISVTGICADWFAETLSPRLSNVGFPSAELGRQAASMLVRRLQERAQGLPGSAEHVIIPPIMAMRGTTGVPRVAV